MKLRLQFKQSGRMRGDCIAPFDVTLSRECTLRELIAAVLERTEEWGYIGIDSDEHFIPYPSCSYRYGKVISNDLTDEELDSPIQSVSATGGWSNMDYFVKLCPAT